MYEWFLFAALRSNMLVLMILVLEYSMLRAYGMFRLYKVMIDSIIVVDIVDRHL